MIRKKIVLIGDFNVGKTSLIRRYVDKAFSDKYLTTIGVKISKKRLQLEAGECELMIWDIEGATRDKAIPQSYLHGASGAIIVADINRDESIRHLEGHISDFLRVNPGSSYVVAYNKSDLMGDREREKIGYIAKSFLTSAKEDLNVEILFTRLVEEMFR